MKFIDAYKKALEDQLKPLVDAGKITLLGTLEELAEDITKAVFQGLKDGAVASDNPYDDVAIPPLVSVFEGRVFKEIDKIDGQKG